MEGLSPLHVGFNGLFHQAEFFVCFDGTRMQRCRQAVIDQFFSLEMPEGRMQLTEDIEPSTALAIS